MLKSITLIPSSHLIHHPLNADKGFLHAGIFFVSSRAHESFDAHEPSADKGIDAAERSIKPAGTEHLVRDKIYYTCTFRGCKGAVTHVLLLHRELDDPFE